MLRGLRLLVGAHTRARRRCGSTFKPPTTGVWVCGMVCGFVVGSFPPQPHSSILFACFYLPLSDQSDRTGRRAPPFPKGMRAPRVRAWASRRPHGCACAPARWPTYSWANCCQEAGQD